MSDKRRSGQWFGDAELQTITAGSAVGKVIQLLPTVSSLQSMRDVVFERVIITFQTRRILATALEGYAFVVWHGEVLTGTSTPTQGLDPLSLISFSWADRNIMHFGALAVPPTQLTSADAAVIGNELVPAMCDTHVKRSVGRANQGIFLKVSSDVSSVLKCHITWRTYYTYAD